MIPARFSRLFRSLTVALVTLSISLLSVGCGQETASPEPVATNEQPAAEIDWFDGSVEDAFALAKEERRPVFLYWGAVWCPPCHALRTKLFTQPEFVARLSATVPVYLDGDTERAQIWGEKLGTYGYPTVIVLDPDGNEITRIAGTLPVEEYGEAVSRAIEASKPLSEIIAAIDEGGPASVPPAELSILAFHSYGQDKKLDLGIERERALFHKLRTETPDDLRVEKSRFLTLEIFALADDNDEVPKATLTDEQRKVLISEVKGVLADRMLRNANLDLVLYGSTTTVKLLTPQPGETRDSLIAAWTDASRAIAADESLSTDDRLTAIYPRVKLAALDTPDGEETEFPESLQNEIREGVKWASSVVKDEDEMQAVMSTMAGLLEDAGLADEAGKLLTEKMSETTAPYYYMGWLAGLEADAGNKEKAVDLYRQAWLSAKGSGSASSMSAFRWGSSYLRRAMQYTPDNVDVIAADTETVVGDLLSGPDAFSGGNWSRLTGIRSAMVEWKNEAPDTRGPVLEELDARVKDACGGYADDGPDSGGARCRSFADKPA